MPPDNRRFPCPSCGRTVLTIGAQCGFCGKYCTEARVREAELARKKAQAGTVMQAELELEGLPC